VFVLTRDGGAASSSFGAYGSAVSVQDSFWQEYEEKEPPASYAAEVDVTAATVDATVAAVAAETGSTIVVEAMEVEVEVEENQRRSSSQVNGDGNGYLP
jgi:hypothetical protein